MHPLFFIIENANTLKATHFHMGSRSIELNYPASLSPFLLASDTFPSEEAVI